MSWDLYIDDIHIGNYTHNMNRAIRAAFLGHDPGPQPSVAGEVLFREPTLGPCWNNFNGSPAKEVLLFCQIIHNEITQFPEKYRQYEPSNGWGSLESLLEFIKDIERACMRNPNGKFEASG